MTTTDNLLGPDDKPSALVTLSNALQHVGILLAINVAFPLIVLDALGDRAPDEDRYVGLAFVVLGLATLLQCARTRFVGSGLLVPATFTAAYIPGLVLAAERGGVPLMAGMLLVSAAVEITIGLLLWRIRHFITVELAGVVVLGLGLLLAIVGFRLIMSIDGRGEVLADAAPTPALGLLVFAAMGIWAVYAPGRLRSLAALGGLVLGGLLAPLFGAVEPDALAGIGTLPLLDAPLPFPLVPTFDPTLLPEFVIAGTAVAFQAVGAIIMAERASFPGWRRPDYLRTTRGVVADGAATAASALCGSMGVAPFSGSVGIAAAAGVMSRVVAQATGVILILIGLCPPVRLLARSIPSEVSGAILLFAAVFVIANGVLVIGSRSLDNRRMMVVGTAIAGGTLYAAFPLFFEGLPAPLGTFVQSNLTASVLVGVVLTLLFSIGQATRFSACVSAGDIDGALSFARAACAGGGVARDVAERVAASIEEIVAAADAARGTGEIELVLSVSTEKVVLSARSPLLAELAAAPDQLYAPPRSLDEIEDVDAFLAGLRRRLLVARGSEAAILDREGVTQVRIVYDQ